MSKVLARNPLSQSIFTKTTDSPLEEQLSRNQEPVPISQEPLSVYRDRPAKAVEPISTVSESRSSGPTTVPSVPVLPEQTEKVTCKLSVEINDWLDGLLRNGRRKHGSKIPKETWIQAALELFRSQSQDWSEVATIEQLREKLQLLVPGNR